MSITVACVFLSIRVLCEESFIFKLDFTTVATGHSLISELCACGVLVVCSLEIVTLYVGHHLLMTAIMAGLGVDPVDTAVAFFLTLIYSLAVEMIGGGDALAFQYFIAVYAFLGLKTLDRTGRFLFNSPFSGLTAVIVT